MQRKIPELKPPFIERMKKLLPDKKDFQNYLEILKQEPVRSIRCNTLKISVKDLKKRLDTKAWKIKQPWKKYPEVMIVEGKIAEPEGSNINGSKSQADFSLRKSDKGEGLHQCCDELHNDIKNNFLISKSSKRSSLRAISRDCITTKTSEIGSLKSGTEQLNRGAIATSNLQNLEPGELGRALEHLLGYYYIQELASMLPILILNPKSGENFLDLCAAPGSKTTQAAAKMENSGNIIANELSIGRLRILASNLERCGVMNTIITKKEGAALCKRLVKYNSDFKFDKILIDAPCSGEGTLRSSPKTYSMWNIKTIKNLPKIQFNLFRAGFEVLKIGGEIVYSTCTHAPEENESVVDKILKEFGNKIKILEAKLPFKAREGILNWEEEKFDKRVKNCARIYPHDNDTEGFFVARFRKLG